MARIKSDSEKIAKLERSQRKLRRNEEAHGKQVADIQAAHEKRVANLIDSHKKDIASLTQCYQKVQTDAAARHEEGFNASLQKFLAFLEPDAFRASIGDLKDRVEAQERVSDKVKASVNSLIRDKTNIEAQLAALRTPAAAAAPQGGAAEPDAGPATMMTTSTSSLPNDEAEVKPTIMLPYQAKMES